MQVKTRGTGRIAVASLALVILIVLALVTVPAPAFADDGVSTEHDADRVHIDIRVDENGDAIWRVSYRVHLETESDRAAFDDLKADIESDPTPYVNRYDERMSDAATTASDATGREMAIENMTVRAERDELPSETGIVEYRFRWTNFAHVDGGSITAGDAIDGLFLDEDTSLLIGGPDGWVIDRASPEPTDDRTDVAVWRGPFEFADNEPRVALAPEDTSLLTPATVGVVLVIALLVLLGGAGWAIARARDDVDGLPIDQQTNEDDDGVDTELLSNEEQVIQVLEDHGGRMKQKELAEALDWTAAKTSQVTTSLRDEGRIEGFRLGRENVLKLPDDSEESADQ